MTRVLRYDSVMAKNDPPFDVTCPCCSAVLKVDAEIKGVIAHTAAVKPKMFADIEEAARAMKEQDSRRDSIFRQSVEAQKNASNLWKRSSRKRSRRPKKLPIRADRSGISIWTRFFNRRLQQLANRFRRRMRNMARLPLLLGHRGARASTGIPENTFASFDLALEHGCAVLSLMFALRRAAPLWSATTPKSGRSRLRAQPPPGCHSSHG